jgi:ABC-type polysaccharide/polyol phosphate transport system ATPase subunit
MARIVMDGVTVEFPLYHTSSRSLKKSLLNRWTGARLARDASDRVCVKALDNITAAFEHGDRVALVGINGAGKTSLLRVLAGIYRPISGSLLVEGKVASLFEIGLGIDGEATGYENILLRGLLYGLTPQECRECAQEVADFTELGEYLSMPVRTYSEGMKIRLAFAVATSLNAEVLLMDEWIGTSDARFLEKARQRMETFVQRSSILVLASHSLEIVTKWCNKGILLHQGSVRMVGDISDVLTAYHELIHSS